MNHDSALIMIALSVTLPAHCAALSQSLPNCTKFQVVVYPDVSPCRSQDPDGMENIVTLKAILDILCLKRLLSLSEKTANSENVSE